MAEQLKRPGSWRWKWRRSWGSRLQRTPPTPLERAATFKRRIVTICLAAVAVTSGGFTYLGVVAQGEAVGGAGWDTKAWALVFAICVSLILFLFWFIAFGLTPLLPTRTRKALAVLITILGLPWIISTSSVFNAQGLIGYLAQIEALRDGTDQYDEAVRRAYEQNIRVRQLRTSVRAKSTYLRGLAEGELERGVLSGAAGGGVVAASLMQAADQMGVLEEDLEEALLVTEATVAEAQAAIERMRTVVYDTALSVPAREAVWVKQALLLDRLIADLRHGSLLSSVRQVADSLAASVISPADGESQFSRKQAEAVRGVAASLKEIGDAMASEVRDLEQLALPEPPRVRPLNPTEAVVAYAHKFPANWAAAIGVDTSPLVLLLFLMLADTRRSNERHPWENILTLGDHLPAELMKFPAGARELGRELTQTAAKPKKRGAR